LNKNRREKLATALSKTKDALTSVECVLFDEETALDNIPENLRETEKCEAIGDNVGHLEEAVEHLENAISYIEAVI
jgi:hypothetical protein